MSDIAFEVAERPEGYKDNRHRSALTDAVIATSENGQAGQGCDEWTNQKPVEAA